MGLKTRILESLPVSDFTIHRPLSHWCYKEKLILIKVKLQYKCHTPHLWVHYREHHCLSLVTIYSLAKLLTWTNHMLYYTKKQMTRTIMTRKGKLIMMSVHWWKRKLFSRPDPSQLYSRVCQYQGELNIIVWSLWCQICEVFWIFLGMNFLHSSLARYSDSSQFDKDD